MASDPTAPTSVMPSTEQATASNNIVGVDIDPEHTRPILRFLTCGSVDDGKSTLIGRLLFDSQLVFEDHLETLAVDSKRVGTTGGEIDLALLVDGLQAEREQGITIDVAYRYFATPNRKFIVADTPGHAQYTRNMATGASVCDLAILLIDARKGVLTQTRRHATIAHMLGIRHLVLAVNKMDLVNYGQARFEAIVEEFNAFGSQLGIQNVVAVPMSARDGDNVTTKSERMEWYHGATLLAHLETVDASRESDDRVPFRLPVQWVCRPNLDFRGYAGTLIGMDVQPGDPVVVLPAAKETTVKSIVTYDGEIERAGDGDAVILTLADEIDVSRGDVIAATNGRPEAADQVAAHVIWMSDEPMYPGRSYLVKCGTQIANATITNLKHKVNVDTLAEEAGKGLELNEIGYCDVSISKPLVFDPYDDARQMGGFILIDRLTNATMGAGMIRFGLRRATNVHWRALDIDRAARAGLKDQTPACLWFTGLSGSGKSTVANIVEKQLHAAGRHTYILDGDNVRHRLNRDLGFSEADRVENIRRVSEVARLMMDAGLIVLVSFISPFQSEREMARNVIGDNYLEVFVDTPLEICEQRDIKGLYKKARAGEIKNFTGIDSPYEAPDNPELHLDGAAMTAEQMAEQVIKSLTAKTGN